MRKYSKDIACFSVSLLVTYAQKKGVSIDPLFHGIQEHRKQLSNPLEWVDAEIWTVFARNFEQAMGGRPNILYEVGKEITEKQFSNFPLLFLKIAPLSLIISNMGHYMENHINTILKLKVNLIRDGELDVIFTPADTLKYSQQICDFNRGCTFAALRLKGYKNPSLTELICAARNDSHLCHYKLKWTSRHKSINRVRDFFFFRFRDQQTIIRHMEESHKSLQDQYKEILSLKDFYSHSMENMTEGILWLNRDGKIIFTNRGFSAISGYRQEELQGRCFWNFLSNETSPAEYRDIFIRRLSTPNVSETEEFIILTKTGEKRIGQTNFMWVTSEHYTSGFLISIRDITDTKSVERKLYTLQDRYRSLYENSPAIIVGLDPEGNFTYANPAMEQQSGYTEQELKRMHFKDLISPDADFDVQRLFADIIHGIHSKEVHYRTKSGEWKEIVLNTFPVRDDSNTPVGIAGIGVDVTETKRLNEQLIQTQRMDLLGKMAGGLVHDFNNVLSAIMGFSQMIQNKSPEETIQKYALHIRKASERAAGLTRNLLTFSRGEIVKKSTFNLNELLAEVQNLVIPIIPHAIKITAEIPEKKYHINGDSGKMHQCLLNLCLNARDAIGDGRGTIIMRLLESSKKESVIIEVEDSGKGIPPDIIGHIFDPFFSTKAKQNGTGLGLSVVYGVVRIHDGEISVDSRPGEGTTFRIELPTQPFLTDEIKEGKREISGEAALLTGTIMIVDDDELMREFCTETLRSRNHPLVLFDDSHKALEWFKKNHTDAAVALVNIAMPQMDGIEMVKQFRTIKKDLKVIWMSAYLPPEKNRPSESDPVLKKPFTSDDLLQTVKTVF